MNVLIKNLPPLIIAQFTLSSGVKLKSRWPEIGSDTRATPSSFSLSPLEQSYCACPSEGRKNAHLQPPPNFIVSSATPFPSAAAAATPTTLPSKNETRAFLPRRLAAHGRVGGARMEMCFFLSLFALHHLVTRCRRQYFGSLPTPNTV
jgi:hypothetical protein